MNINIKKSKLGMKQVFKLYLPETGQWEDEFSDFLR